MVDMVIEEVVVVVGSLVEDELVSQIAEMTDFQEVMVEEVEVEVEAEGPIKSGRGLSVGRVVSAPEYVIT